MSDNKRTIKISKASITSNIKRNKKLILIIIAISLVLGIFAGIYEKKNYQEDKNYESKEKYECISLDEMNASDCFGQYKKIKIKADKLQLYYYYLLNIQVTQENKELIDKYSAEYLLFYEQNILPWVESYLKTTPSIDVEKDLSMYKECLSKEKREIKEIEKELEQTNISSSSPYYKKFMEKEEKLKAARHDADSYTMLIKNLETQSHQESNFYTGVYTQSNESLVKELNIRISKFNELLSRVAKTDHYEIIYNNRFNKLPLFATSFDNDTLNLGINQAAIYARSIEGLDVGMERFYASLLFFICVGVVVAVLVGVLYCKEKK